MLLGQKFDLLRASANSRGGRENLIRRSHSLGGDFKLKKNKLKSSDAKQIQ